MSRWGGGRQSGDDLAYGDLPQRWDRSRFERFGGGGGGPPPPRGGYEEDYHYRERDTPGRRDIAVADRIDERGPRGRYEERDRYFEEDRYTPRGQRRRTDRELFGDVDPREIAGMALQPYRRKSVSRDDYDIDIEINNQRGPPRPGIVRRQSSLDTFNRRPIPRYEREEHRIPAYTPVPLPYRRREDDYDYERRGREYYEPEDYREVEITREKSVHRRGGPQSVKSPKSSKAKSVTTRRSSSSSDSTKQQSIHESVHESRHGGKSSFHESARESKHGAKSSFHESFHEDYSGPGESFHESFHESEHGGNSSVHESIQQTEKQFKKGKTRMPKRLVRREAIMDLGYPFDEEEDFFVLRIALGKEQIDEVIRITETYKNGEKKTVYKYDEQANVDLPAIMPPPEEKGEHEEVIRTEWINPPTVVGARSHRSHSRSEHKSRRSSSSSKSGTTRRTSPTRTARSHRTSRSRHHSQPPPPEFYEDRKTTIEERSPGPPPPPSAPPAPVYYEERKTTVEENQSSHHSSHHHHRSPSHGPSHGHGTLVLQDREYRSDRDINAEIARLEAERRALRLEREADDRRNMALQIRERPSEEYQLVEYNEPRRAREVYNVYEREKSPERNVLRVEKDRKGRMALVKSSH